jgi:hypothetical protein
MTERRPERADVPVNFPEPDDMAAKQRELEGDRPVEDQSAIIDQSDVEGLGYISETDIYQGELEAGVNDRLPENGDSLELLTELELRDEETDDVMEAVESGFTYIPPIDPPTVPDAESFDDVRVASGFGVSSLDDEYDADGHSDFVTDDDEMSARVRAALRADSATSRYADQLAIETRGNTVVIRGVVDDLTDNDNILAVAEHVSDIDEVVDQMTVRTME